MKPPKNIVDSVKARLLNLARNEERSHQLILLRYFQERFLFRLSQSVYRENFYLKGGAFLYALDHKKSRVTKDVDFLGINISSSNDRIFRVIEEICQVPYELDGIYWDLNSIELSEIIKDDTYKGVRVELIGYLDRTRQKIQIDIGFGDMVSPGPVEMAYPVLLDLEVPNILAYSIESVIAEKFEAMISLAEINTRMKDFYDLHQLFQRFDIPDAELARSIQVTFQKRGTKFTSNHSLFTDAFAEHSTRLGYWEAWINKTGLDKSLTFAEIMNIIRERLYPIYESLEKGS